MSRVFTQKELGDFLVGNPLGVPVHVGDLDNMNGNDYIFLDYLNDAIIPFDNMGDYKTTIQISIYCKDFINRKILVDYIKTFAPFSIEYLGSSEGNYFEAILKTEIFLN